MKGGTSRDPYLYPTLTLTYNSTPILPLPLSLPLLLTLPLFPPFPYAFPIFILPSLHPYSYTYLVPFLIPVLIPAPSPDPFPVPMHASIPASISILIHIPSPVYSPTSYLLGVPTIPNLAIENFTHHLHLLMVFSKNLGVTDGEGKRKEARKSKTAALDKEKDTRTGQKIRKCWVQGHRLQRRFKTH